ncbi:MAG TPA: serine/threonine-protein kinase [Pseudonocardiaceae bacterium]
MTAGDLGGYRLVAGRYAVLGELGRGGFGVVWRAEDRVIGRQVALKELRVPPGLGERESAAFTERVLREARTAGRLNDPAIVTVYDVVREGGAMFIVMELVEASTLAELVSRDGPLPPDRAGTLGLAVLSALETAHAAGIVHRDIKPSNIMLLGDGRVKLADFGIAQAMDDPSLTATGGVLGSPGYLAPELFRGAKPGPASDLWSLGATLFHVVEGRGPFHRDTTAATLHAIMYEDPVLTRCQGPLAAVIMGLLVHSVADRLTASQVRELLTGQGIATVAVPTELVPPVGDPERTVRIGPVRRSTRPYDTPAPDGADATTTANPLAAPVAPHWGGDWAPQPERGRRRRGVLLTVAAVLLVIALAGVALALTGPKQSTAASGPAQRHDTAAAPVASTSAAAGPAGGTAGSVASSIVVTTTRAAVVTTSVAPTRGRAPLPPPVPPPTSPTAKLTFLAIARYHNTTNGYHLTAKIGSPLPAGYSEEGPLGYLVATAEPGTLRLYLCKMSSSPDYFSSVDQTGHCEGQTTVAMLGYLYSTAPAGMTSALLYRCNSGASHYDSLRSDCEGNGTKEGQLGYVI